MSDNTPTPDLSPEQEAELVDILNSPGPQFIDKSYQVSQEQWNVIQLLLGEPLTPVPIGFRLVRPIEEFDLEQAVEVHKIYPDFPDPKHTPLLMSKENPNGWTWQNIAAQLYEEMQWKNAKLASDPRPIAQIVVRNNNSIMGALGYISDLTIQSMSLLSLIGPNQGPLGKPRVGVDSEQK